jgi:hypothetical protein
MPNKIFRSNAFVVLKYMRPALIVLLDPIEADIVVSSIGLRWNAASNRRLSIDYRVMLDYLMEKLPKERKFIKGGVFYAQIHQGKLAPWKADIDNDLAAAMYISSKKPDDICMKNLRITLGEYAGDDIKSAIVAALHKRMAEIFEEKRREKVEM